MVDKRNPRNSTQNPLRILFISRCPPYPLHLGDRLILWHLARELAAHGHVLDLLAYTQFPTDADEQNHYQQFFRHIELLPEPTRSTGDYVKRLMNSARRFPKKAEDAWSPDMWRAIQGRLAKRPYDIVHVFGGIQVYEFYQAVRDIPAIITPYESYSLYLKRLIQQSGGMMNRLNQQIAREFERWMFTPFARTIVVAQPDKDELNAINPSLPVEVISNGIDLTYFSGTRDNVEPCTLLFVGNYEYAPNVDAASLLANVILPEVRRSLPDTKLLLVGNAPPPEVQALQNDAVTVTGRVPDIRVYHERAVAFVCPLQIGAGIKNKVLEALAMGVPVVATPLSVDGIDVQHNQSALIADVAQIPGEIVRLLNEKSLQQTLSATGRALIEHQYSWSRVAAQYEMVYQKIRFSPHSQ